MPGPAQKPRRFTPAGLSDATDGTDAFAGACPQLANLIPQPNARGVWVPRPAMIPQVIVPNWATATSALVTVGNIAYGMAGSTLFSGKDAPFIYSGNAFTSISGLTSAQLPVSQATTGDWTPPTISQIAGRIVFTHPGFAGGTTFPLENIVFTAVVASGQTTFIGPDYLYTLPVAGLNVSDSLGYVPANTTMVSAVPSTVIATGSGTAGGTNITLTSISGVSVGMSVFFPGGQSIISAIAGSTLTVPNALTQSFTSQQVLINGTTLTMSKAATNSGAPNILLTSPSPALKFGWLDISSFSTTLVANAVGNTLSGSFSLDGVQPGMLVSGPNVPANTTVVNLRFANFSVYGQTVSGSPVIQLGAYPGGDTPYPGQFISGPNIPSGTVILAYNPAAFQVTMSNAATATAIGQTFTVSGTLIQLSAYISPSTVQQNYTISGGTPAAPLWGAGDMAINPLAGTSPPVFVNSLSARAYFGVNTPSTAGVQASDAGTACVQTFETQALTFNDSTPVLAAGQLELSTLTGGMNESLIVFQSDEIMNQITGDFLTAISINVLNAPGTLAPLTIAACPRGLLYMASDGLRLITHAAEVSDPIGSYGQGITLPMMNALTPTRASASFNENVYRLTVTWQPPPTATGRWGAAPRTDEFWFHLAELGKPLHESRWSGQHSSILTFSAPFPAKNSFVCVTPVDPSRLYTSDVRPFSYSSYVEFGAQLQCILQTLLLPDNPAQNAVEVNETTMWIGYNSSSGEVLVTAIDDMGQVLDQAYVWIGAISLPAQRSIPWHQPLVFRQMQLQVQAGATPQLQFGAIAIRDEMLDYQLPYPIPPEFLLGEDILGGPNVVGP